MQIKQEHMTSVEEDANRAEEYEIVHSVNVNQDTTAHPLQPEQKPEVQKDEPSKERVATSSGLLSAIAKFLILLSLPAGLALTSIPPLLPRRRCIVFDGPPPKSGPNKEIIDRVADRIQLTLSRYFMALEWVDKHLMKCISRRLFPPHIPGNKNAEDKKHKNPYKRLLARHASIRRSDRIRTRLNQRLHFHLPLWAIPVLIILALLLLPILTNVPSVLSRLLLGPPSPDYILIDESLRKQICFRMWMREKQGLVAAGGAQYVKVKTGEVGSVAVAQW